ncbi:tryptophanyl-tRNA synthetase [Dichomitus squalens LYAD-421 SS1]|uniref:Tryptophan--tRNA ligase, mitochondrial n=1 Tax=Dichomitus squalens (strain LYAD-421) TaxID=732165 RepID=R7SJG0_DICSQ|nr:tryptophanyl-tRNA synthetase [Dichomitus squalens LYAD-421 SS1]EJF56291.1 tryptophanyl-tRNA synthetase [Dichomitus squalens LYAD-421 SS1]
MSLFHQHLRRAPAALSSAWRSLHSRHTVARGIITTSVAHNESQEVRARPRVVFSGIQPTGIPHIGNLLGALLNWVKLQRDASPEDQLIYSIVGWHALTLPQDPRALSVARRDMLAVLLAVGLDPNRSVIFHQDENPHHAELAWILNCITPMGKLRRMTTWKSRLAASRNARDDSEVDESLLNAGLFTYPVLQAADILAYRATHVPVGEDQQQHIELCRDLAESFNRTYKGKRALFPLPQHVITSSCRVLSLRDPSSKMSKSSPDLNSRILLTDTPAQVRSKIRSAVTDSTLGITYDPETRPGAANLLSILAACTDEDVQVVAARYIDKGHGDLKTDVAEAVEELLTNPRAEFERLRKETAYLEEVAKAGAEKARALTEPVMKEVRTRIGLV